MIVVTGGPGAGKTALLEVVRRAMCRHVLVLGESASILYGGGFPRRFEPAAKRATQRAIFRVQRELERMAAELDGHTFIICDRGTVDGAAYWPGAPDELFAEVGSTLATEVARYHAVVHLRTPPPGRGYTNANPLRIESAEEAARLDGRIAELWSAHPRRFFVESEEDFFHKLMRALEIVRELVPDCCAANRPGPVTVSEGGVS
jgi:predicted ATPase